LLMMRVIRPRNFDRRARRAGLDEDDLADLIKAWSNDPILVPSFPELAAPAKCG
jgi:hypothetical protein